MCLELSMFLKNNKILEACLDTGFQTNKRTLLIKGYLTKVNLTWMDLRYILETGATHVKTVD